MNLPPQSARERKTSIAEAARLLPGGAGDGISGGNRKALAVVCCLAEWVYALYLGVLGVMLPEIGKTFGLGAAVQSRLFPVNFAGFIASVLVCGALSDRYGRKRVLIAGTALYAIGLTLFGVAPAFGWTLVAAPLVGGGAGVMATIATALASDIYPHRRTVLINAMNIAFGLGAALGPVLAQILLNQRVSWRVFFDGVTVVSFALVVFMAVLRFPTSSAVRESLDWQTFRRVLRLRPVWLLCLTTGLYAGTEVGFFEWLPNFYREQFAGGANWNGLTVTLFWLTMSVARFALTGTMGRVSLPRLMQALGIVSAVGIGLTVLQGTPIAAAICVAVAAVGLSGVYPSAMSETARRYPQFAGTVLGAVATAGGIGVALIPWLMGSVAGSAHNWRAGLALGIVTALGFVVSARLLENATE